MDAIVVTTISAPTKAVREIAAYCKHSGQLFCCIGDRKSPNEFSVEGCRFIGIEQQSSLPFRLVGLLPEHHYARKNLGYLVAARAGATGILETDDDNIPMDGFWNERNTMIAGREFRARGWVNSYQYFTENQVWPRGLPLQYIRSQKVPEYQATRECPVQQSLANGDPDVDAIYRLTIGSSVNFAEALPIILGNAQWSPFNSQNTWWDRTVFPLMYLPSFCSIRMTDIWRSLMTQRCLWAMGKSFSVHPATVVQERNYHDLTADFELETPGYLHNHQIADQLEELVDIEVTIKGRQNGCNQTFNHNAFPRLLVDG